MTIEERIITLDARIMSLEKQVEILLECDKTVRETELALADGGAI